jgi:hypothetical protein
VQEPSTSTAAQADSYTATNEVHGVAKIYELGGIARGFLMRCHLSFLFRFLQCGRRPLVGRPSRDPAGRHGNRRRRTGDAGSAARPDGGANSKTYFFFLGAFLPFLRALESAMAMGGNGAPNHDGWRRIHPIAIVIVGPQERAIASVQTCL